MVGPSCAPSTSSRRGSPAGRARRAGVATECRTGGHNTDDVGFVQASSRRTTLFLLPALSVLSGILGPDVEWRGAAMAAEDTGALRTAYFGAGDAKQLAPYFRSLSYRGVRSAAVGLAEGVEVVRVVYDGARVPFSDLLRIYFRRVDARDAGGQFKERGARFAPAVWCGDGPSRDFEEAERVLALLGRSGVFGNDPTEPLAVRIVPGLPSSFEVDEEADAAVLPQGEALKKLMRKSGRYQKLDDPKGIWGYESYCVDGVCGYYTPAPKCQGECRKYYPDGGLGLSS